MRFMIILKSDHNTEAGVMPTEQELTDMGNFNEELVKAGVMLAGDPELREQEDRLRAQTKAQQ